MNDRSWRHPKVATMAAFVEGTLAPDEVTEVAEHLRGCRDCRTVVGETARFEVEESLRSEAEEAARVKRPRFRARLWAAAAAAAGVITLSVPLVQRTAAYSPVSLLIDAAPRENRMVEGRLSGFEYARPPVSQRGDVKETPEELELKGEAGKVLRLTKDDDDAKDIHAAGVAHLLVDDTTESIANLERAARIKNEPRYWNDLAVAHMERADKHPSALPEALAAVSKAIRLDPEFAPAVFNRALILEKSGLKDDARREWTRYLDLDASSGWSTEARTHLGRLDSRSASDPRKELHRVSLALDQGDRSPVETFVRQSPQDARRMAEFELTEWAKAEASGETAKAVATLNLVRAISETLLATNGDGFLLDAVHTIDRADSPTRRTLAAAYRRYADARRAYAERDVGRAEVGFREAEAMFAAVDRPRADRATYFRAQAIANENRAQESIDILLQLRARIDAQQHPSLAAEIEWQLGLSSLEAGEYSAAVGHTSAASAAFSALGESKNAAFMDGIAAHALERLGASDLAWERWVRAFHGSDRRAVLLVSAAQALAATERPEAAKSMIDLLLQEGTAAPISRVEYLTDLVLLAQRSGDLEVARRSLSEARTVAKEISDPTLNATANARIELADAASSGASPSGAALASLNRAVEFFRDYEKGLKLPGAYLQRARARHAAGDEAAALADYRAALNEVARQRERAGDVRQGFLDTAAEIIDDTIALHLSRGEIVEAFAVTDRAHGMLEPAAVPALPADVALIEYAVLPGKTVIFCVTRGGIFVAMVPIERRALGDKIASLAENVRSQADVAKIRDEAAALHQLLIAPVRARLEGIDEIVVVPDRQLSALPFPLLYDGKRYLIQDYTLRLAPSAHARKAAPEVLQPAAVFADPPTVRWPSLPYSREEAEKVAAVRGAKLFTGGEATRQRFLDALRTSALVHYAGHADSDAGESYGALLLAASENDPGILAASDIARLPLHENAPLIVLSACGTFRGTTTHVAGMPSLARAFLDAGARAVVGTLWEVDDDRAAPLFTRFHDHLRAGSAPARALRDAQIEMLQSSDPRQRHPSTWSAVEVLSNL